jgi:predicted nucleotidyltransferase
MRGRMEEPEGHVDMPVDLSAYFEKFLDNISLKAEQVRRMDSAADTICGFLRDRYRLAESAVFLQGSYANGTAIEPVEGGEYDVDIVCVSVAPGQTSNAALDDLESLFRSDGRFRDRVHGKKPCVRLEYAEDEVGKFHVDVVPVRRTGVPQPPLEAPRRNEGWHETAPAEYTRWCAAQGPLYVRTVKAMKRWRDEQQTVRTAVKSIVLQVLIAQAMPRHERDDAERLRSTLHNLYDMLQHLDRPPVIANPVLPSENLAKRWTPESFRSFVGELSEAMQWADKAAAATDTVEAADAWRELLGDDFPVLSPSQLGFRVADYSHAHSPATHGWTRRLDSRYAVRVSATVQRGRRGQNRRRLANDGPLVFAGHKLRFYAHRTGPPDAQVWWQVANTGGHARARSALRGEIFRGRDLSKRPTRDDAENWEDTAYTGTHLTRALLVRNNVVVAESDWFKVNIYARGWRFTI